MPLDLLLMLRRILIYYLFSHRGKGLRGTRERRGDDGTESGHRGKHRDKGRRGTGDKAPRQGEAGHRDKEARHRKGTETRHRRQGSMDGVGVFQVGGLGHYYDEKYL